MPLLILGWVDLFCGKWGGNQCAGVVHRHGNDRSGPTRIGVHQPPKAFQSGCQIVNHPTNLAQPSVVSPEQDMRLAQLLLETQDLLLELPGHSKLPTQRDGKGREDQNKQPARGASPLRSPCVMPSVRRASRRPVLRYGRAWGGRGPLRGPSRGPHSEIPPEVPSKVKDAFRCGTRTLNLFELRG